MAKAYSYIRFSRPEQLRGDSLRRQRENAEEWAAANGHAIDESITDLGVSGLGKPGSGQLQVVRQLKSQNKLREAADQPDSPSYIRDRTPLKKGQMTTGALRDELRRDPALTILLSDDVFRKAVQNGINEGVYVYQREGLLAGQGDPILIIYIDEQSVASTVDFAKQKGLWPRQAPTQVDVSGGGTTPPTGDGSTTSGPSSPDTDGGSEGGGFTTSTTPAAYSTSMKEFAAEGVLKEALRRVFEQTCMQRSANASACSPAS